MVELILIGSVIVIGTFIYVYIKEKLDQNEKLPFDKHLRVH